MEPGHQTRVARDIVLGGTRNGIVRLLPSAGRHSPVTGGLQGAQGLGGGAIPNEYGRKSEARFIGWMGMLRGHSSQHYTSGYASPSVSFAE